MSYNIYQRLNKLLKKHGTQEFGRICQAFLELTFREIGFKTHGRPVERPDISAERGSESYAVEVKTSDSPNVNISARDLEGIKDYERSGVLPILAVLSLELNPEWVIIDASKIRPGNYNKIALGIYSIRSLSEEINSNYDNIVSRYFQLALDRGSEGVRSRLS